MQGPPTIQHRHRRLRHRAERSGHHWFTAVTAHYGQVAEDRRLFETRRRNPMWNLKHTTLSVIAVVSLAGFAAGPAVAEQLAFKPQQFLQSQTDETGQFGTAGGGNQAGPGGPRPASDQIGDVCMPGTDLDKCWEELNKG
jgi:hypothetical protein